MRKKYIIELEDNKLAYQAIMIDGTPYIKPLQLLPYTEPDLEQAKDEAYNEGYKAGREAEKVRQPDIEQVRCQAYEEGRNSLLIEVQKAGKNTIKLEEDEYYQRGLADAWEAARKICANWCISDDDLALIFGKGKTIDDIMREFTATEAIEKLKAYEQEQETDGLRQNIQTIVDKCGYSLDEIATVLEKMREGQDG